MNSRRPSAALTLAAEALLTWQDITRSRARMDLRGFNRKKGGDQAQAVEWGCSNLREGSAALLLARMPPRKTAGANV
jgi:hypothetical protein